MNQQRRQDLRDGVLAGAEALLELAKGRTATEIRSNLDISDRCLRRYSQVMFEALKVGGQVFVFTEHEANLIRDEMTRNGHFKLAELLSP